MVCSMEPHILMSITDGFFLLLVYSVKKIDRSGKAIYLTAGISKRARKKD